MADTAAASGAAGTSAHDSAAGGDQPGRTSQAPRGLKEIFVELVERKLELLLWLSRMATITFTVLYFIGGPSSYYQKALISNGVTSALRLHQRMPQVRLNTQFLAHLITEDSCHYLYYSLIFVLLSSPVSVMVLAPPALFALLHSAGFSLQLLSKAGLQNSKFAEILRAVYVVHRVSIFHVIAITEIMLLVLLIIGVFTGRVILMAPFVYCRFLSQRYASNRNPYSRNVFRDLRLQFESVARHRSCPPIVSRAIFGFVMFISARAPVLSAAPNRQPQ